MLGHGRLLVPPRASHRRRGRPAGCVLLVPAGSQAHGRRWATSNKQLASKTHKHRRSMGAAPAERVRDGGDRGGVVGGMGVAWKSSACMYEMGSIVPRESIWLRVVCEMVCHHHDRVSQPATLSPACHDVSYSSNFKGSGDVTWLGKGSTRAWRQICLSSRGFR
ncbi:hypothetical protein IWZ00DRAFT_300524 [Phyllosticta capitalensis]|uniref:Uncharacterized protein n=1 Tax=Phyllosticta capitalensis TaxID=121624 RepID=A0ABR1YL21_9PEZI